MVKLCAECAADQAAITELLDTAFGPDRFKKTSYRYRQGVDPITELSFVAIDEHEYLVGSIRYWPVRLGHGQQNALLLGPLAVDPALRGRGVGRALVFTSLAEAEALGFETIFLVGDPSYYSKFGFETVPAHIVMPFEQPRRLQYRLLGDAALPTRATELLPARRAAA